MKKPFFTIIVVSYNAGDKLFKTIDSVLCQTFKDYRILIKDGMSTDGSIERLKEKYDLAVVPSDEEKIITLLESCDNGIYHAMNIATSYLEGKILSDRAKVDEKGGDGGGAAGSPAAFRLRRRGSREGFVASGGT